MIRNILVVMAAVGALTLMPLVSSAEEEKPDSPMTVEGATTIDATKAKELFDAKVAFIDTRKDSDWDAGRIAGAIQLDVKKVLTEESLMEAVAKDEQVVFYCNGLKCPRSSKASKMAVEWGYSKVFYFRYGFPAWKAAGYPVEKS